MALHDFHDFPAFEVVASVEHHVFQEVGDPPVFFDFIQGSRVDAELETHATLGLQIGSDEIFQSVRQDAGDDSGILLEGIGFVCLLECRCFRGGSICMLFIGVECSRANEGYKDWSYRKVSHELLSVT